MFRGCQVMCRAEGENRVLLQKVNIMQIKENKALEGTRQRLLPAYAFSLYVTLLCIIFSIVK